MVRVMLSDLFYRGSLGRGLFLSKNLKKVLAVKSLIIGVGLLVYRDGFRKSHP